MGCNSSKSATVVDSADRSHPPAHGKATEGKNPDDKDHTDGAVKAQDDHDQKPDNPSDKQKEEAEKEKKDIPPQEAQDSKEETPRSKGD